MAVRVLFLDHASALGGAEQSLLLLLKHLERSRWQPHLGGAKGVLAEQASRLGVPFHAVPMPRLRRSRRAPLDWLHGIQAIAQVIRTTGSRLVVANTVRAALYGAFAARLTGIPFVWHMRDFWLSEDRPRHLWADRAGKLMICAAARRVIANSHATAERLPWRRVHVVHNGIEVDHYALTVDGATFRQQYGIPPEAPVVGMVGRLRPWKGQERFVRVLAKVRRAAPDMRGVIVGGDPFGISNDYAQRLRRLTDDLRMTDCIVFTDHVADVRPALAAMDIFVHPGEPEPFGLVNIEAMAMGKPVVAFAHGALPEIVDHGKTGMLITPGDERAMAQTIIALLHNADLRCALGNAGRQRVRTSFTADRMAREIEVVLKEALRRKAHRDEVR